MGAIESPVVGAEPWTSRSGPERTESGVPSREYEIGATRAPRRPADLGTSSGTVDVLRSGRLELGKKKKS